MIFKSTKQDLIYTFINGIEINKVSRGFARWKMSFSQLKSVVIQRIIGRSSNIFPAGESRFFVSQALIKLFRKGRGETKNPIRQRRMGLKR
jgi:hypothetical protein